MKYYIYTLGCKVNNYESEYLKSLLDKEGFIFNEEKPDIIIINTCTVTNTSDKKSKKMIKRYRRLFPNAIIVAMGCYVQYVNGNVEDADIIIGNKDKSKIINYIKEYIENRQKIIKIYDMNNVEFEDMEIKKYTSHTRAFVKIEDGCNNFCSYCIIPYVRGRVRSKDFDKIIEEVNYLVDNGHKEIVLTGIHTGQYNSNGKTLYDLLKELVKIKKLERIRISSIEVVEINDDIIDLIKKESKLVSHLHIPLQSGSDKVLKLMNRRYDKKYFKEKIEKIRKARKDISITTDLIVGFNGESEKEFIESYEFCKEIGFSKIHVFPYSKRDGTKACELSEEVDEKTKKIRVDKFLTLSNVLENEYKEKFIGKTLKVLVEEAKNNYSYGYTTNYIRVILKGNYVPNNMYEIKLSEKNIIMSVAFENTLKKIKYKS